MTEEATVIETSTPETPAAPAPEDKVAAFHAKLAAIKKEEQTEAPEEPEAETPPQEPAPEEAPATLSDDDDEPEGQAIPYSRWKNHVEVKNKLKGELENERQERLKVQVQLENFQQAIKQYFDGQQPQGKTQEETPGFEPLDEQAHSYLSTKIQTLEKKLEDAISKVATKEEVERERATQMFANAIVTQRQAFEAKQPDYQQAFNHLQNVKVMEAEAMLGKGDMAFQRALGDILAIAENTYKNGGNAAETIYKLAKSYGYNAKPATPAAGVNLDALQQNMKKGASDAGSKAAVPMGAGNYLQPGGMKKLKGDDGSVDASKFHQILAKINRGE